MRRPLFQNLLWGVLLLAAAELALLFLAAPEASDDLRRRMAVVTGGVAMVGLAGAFVLARRLRRRIWRLRGFAEGVVSGPPQKIQAEARDDLGALAESLGRVAAQVSDLVERVRLEGARRDAILTGMVEGVLAVDKELRVTFCNSAFATAFGVQGPAPAGLPVLRISWRCCAQQCRRADR